MKLKQLESLLGDLQQFAIPKVELEQYPTGPHIASRMLYTAENSFGDVSDKVVADFGCGCGTLGVAAALLGAEHVIGLDIDSQSLDIALQNAEDLELDINFIQCDIRNLGWRGQIVDTVVMNPPFGTRKKGADMDFLSVALKVSHDTDRFSSLMPFLSAGSCIFHPQLRCTDRFSLVALQDITLDKIFDEFGHKALCALQAQLG